MQEMWRIWMLQMRMTSKDWKDLRKSYERMDRWRKVLRNTYWPLASIPEEADQE